MSITVEDIRKEEPCGRVAALGIVYREVSHLNEQFGKEMRGETFTINNLMKIVERYVWSRHAEEECMQGKSKHQDRYTKLSAALVIWDNEVRRSGQDPEQADDSRSAEVISLAMDISTHIRTSLHRGIHTALVQAHKPTIKF